LPGKLTLPTRGGDTPVATAVKFLRRECSHVAAIVALDAMPLRAYLEYHLGIIDFVIQPEPTGVLSALHLVAVERHWDELLVAFGDCVYAANERCEDCWHDSASVRLADGDHLDGWANKWVRRAEKPKHKFLGWLSLRRETLMAMCAESDDLISAMNRAHITAVQCTAPCEDVGTLDAYLAHWRRK
jgi:hypothetical protein